MKSHEHGLFIRKKNFTSLQPLSPHLTTTTLEQSSHRELPSFFRNTLLPITDCDSDSTIPRYVPYVWGTRVDLNLTNATLELTERGRVVGWLGWRRPNDRDGAVCYEIGVKSEEKKNLLGSRALGVEDANGRTVEPGWFATNTTAVVHGDTVWRKGGF